MAPDLNSLPPSRSVSVTSSMARQATIDSASALRGQSPSPSLRSPTSLQAAAAVNAGLQHEDSRRSSSTSSTRNRQSSHSGRRRSTVLLNLQLNDPALPAPGEMINEEQAAAHRTPGPQPITASPALGSGDSHHRTLSLGEIHQELEQEQEAQVNRLLQMIRTQQQHLQQLQSASGQSHTTPLAIDESTPASERSMSFSTSNPAPQHASATSTPRSPTAAAYPRSSFDLARADIQRRSRTPSQNASPRLRATSTSGEGVESWSLAGRDESAFYQAETQMMIRENQMLRQRIRELERQVSDLHANSTITHEPATSSRLLRSTSVSEEVPTPATVTSSTEEPKE